MIMQGPGGSRQPTPPAAITPWLRLSLAGIRRTCQVSLSGFVITSCPDPKPHSPQLHHHPSPSDQLRPTYRAPGRPAPRRSRASAGTPRLAVTSSAHRAMRRPALGAGRRGGRRGFLRRKCQPTSSSSARWALYLCLLGALTGHGDDDVGARWPRERWSGSVQARARWSRRGGRP